jgi:FeS assembly ATPase SufC
VRNHPDLVRKYLGTVVPASDNFFAPSTRPSSATARSATSPRACAARWSCPPISASTPPNTGQFERTLIIADEGYVSYLKAAPPPCATRTSLHAAVVELVALDNAEIKYSTVQNWYPGDKDGKGGIYNFVTKRGKCAGAQLEDLLDPGGDRLGHHLEIPQRACCMGDNSVGEFYSVALTNHFQQADTGTKMIHIGKNTKQHHHLQGHLGRPRAEHLPRPGPFIPRPRARATIPSAIRCSSATSAAPTPFPTSRCATPRAGGARGVHLAIGEDQIFYCRQRGLTEDAVDRGRRQHDRQRVLQGGVLARPAAHGVRRGSAEAAEHVSLNTYFLRAALNAVRKHRNEEALDPMDFLALVKKKAKSLGLNPDLLGRPVNEGFSGGEKKRNEILQMSVLEPRLAVLDETDSGLDIDALREVAGAIQALRHPDRAIVVITHHQRLLDYLVPDHVHVLSAGTIVASGDKTLAIELEKHGYSWAATTPTPLAQEGAA